MTSLKIFKKQISKFLADETAEVIAIRGAWGTGKTYAWNRRLKKQRDKQIALDKYSYVSLFGINSLEELKFSIFEKSVGKNLIGKKPSLKTFRGNTASLLSGLGKKALPFITDSAAFFRLNDVVGRAVSFLSVNKTIICLDDFERMRLDAMDVLGLISELKEQKACKVVLILNDEKLSEDAKEKYNTYREKVIDKEFKFSPTPEDCAQIVFKKEEDYTEILTERCCKLGIQNIRVIKKIQYFTEQLKEFLEEKEQETKNYVLSSLALLTYSLYVKSDEFPDLEFIKKMNPVDLMLGETGAHKSKDDPEQQRRTLWNDILQDYGYSFFGELDHEILRSVERGYFIDDDIAREIDKYNKIIKINQEDHSLDEAWSTFNNSFDDNAECLVQQMYEATKNNIRHISQVQLNSSIWLLRNLDAGDKANELIELVISSRTDADYFNIKRYVSGGHIDDREMIERFSEVFNQRRDKKTPSEILNQMISKNAWDPADEIVLASMSDDDYFNLFKSEKGDHLTAIIRRCLEFGGYQNPTEERKKINTLAKEALKRIGLESKLNELRIKKFRVED